MVCVGFQEVVAKNITFRFSAGRGLPAHPQDSTPYYVGDMFSIE